MVRVAGKGGEDGGKGVVGGELRGVSSVSIEITKDEGREEGPLKGDASEGVKTSIEAG
jgi:hypothetical protein